MAEHISKPDNLESPEAPWRIILITIGAGLAATLVAVISLGVFYHIFLTGGPEPVRPKPLPRPALETHLFRVARSTPEPASDVPGIDAAMAVVAAKGAHAYDPVDGKTPP